MCSQHTAFTSVVVKLVIAYWLTTGLNGYHRLYHHLRFN